MASRRQFFVALGTAGGLGPAIVWVTGRSSPSADIGNEAFPIQKSDDDWRRVLTSEQYRILRRHATESPFTSPLNQEKRRGIFVCAGCGNELFASQTKFESGTGWPSFWEPMPAAVGTSVDRT